jgi:hypothetical protein
VDDLVAAAVKFLKQDRQSLRSAGLHIVHEHDTFADPF